VKSLSRAVNLGFALPLCWILYFCSNGDPVWVGLLIVVTITIGPLAAILLGVALRKVKVGRVFLWILFVVNLSCVAWTLGSLAFDWFTSKR